MSDRPPDRSLQQRMDALERANDIRVARAILKKDVKAGRIRVISVLENPPKEAQTMKVFELLMSVPGLGRVKVNRLINMCRISPSKRMDGMTERQIDELISHLRRR